MTAPNENEGVPAGTVIEGIRVNILLDQCESLAAPIRVSTRSFQYASALDNAAKVIRFLLADRAQRPSPTAPETTQGAVEAIKLHIPTPPKGWPEGFGATRDPEAFRWLPVVMDGHCGVSSYYALTPDG